MGPGINAALPDQTAGFGGTKAGGTFSRRARRRMDDKGSTTANPTKARMP
jgi:hypothetical protein